MPDADVLEAVAVDVTALVVLGERVQRRAAVGDLASPVGAADGAQEANAGRGRPSRDGERVPDREAELRRADEPAVSLHAQVVEGEAAPVHEDRRAELRVLRRGDDGALLVGAALEPLVSSARTATAEIASSAASRRSWTAGGRGAAFDRGAASTWSRAWECSFSVDEVVWLP